MRLFSFWYLPYIRTQFTWGEGRERGGDLRGQFAIKRIEITTRKMKRTVSRGRKNMLFLD